MEDPLKSSVTVCPTRSAGNFEDDDHCGTFIELHPKDDETILSEVKLNGGFTNGYRTTTIPLIYKGMNNHSVVRHS